MSHDSRPGGRLELREYVRCGDEGDSSGSSSSSSGTDSSSRERTTQSNTFDPFSKKNSGDGQAQPPTQAMPKPAVTLDEFFSNPKASMAGPEETNLLEFSISEDSNTARPPSSHPSPQPSSQKQQNSPSLSESFDPFASWGDGDGKRGPASSATLPSSNGGLSSSARPSASASSLSSQPPSSSASTTASFDPFASSTVEDSGNDLMDLMSGMTSPLKPTTTGRVTSPPSSTETVPSCSQPTASSWSIFTSTSTMSSAGHSQKGWDDIWTKSAKSQQPKSYDPFYEFGNLGGLGSTTMPQDNSSSPKPGSQTKGSGNVPSPMTNRPASQMYGQRAAHLGVVPPSSGSRSGSASPVGRSPSPVRHPNYYSSTVAGKDQRPKYGEWAGSCLWEWSVSVIVGVVGGVCGCGL